MYFIICLSLWANALSANESAPASSEAFERFLLETVNAEALRGWHDLSASEPHPPGSHGDVKLIANMVKAFSGMGLEVEKHEFWTYLGHPVSANVEIVSPISESLPLKESEMDQYSGDTRLHHGWNAYSASGDVTAEIVYANYGTKEDFEWLAANHISCVGKIVIARYGRNFRGYKAKFAQAAGAVGLIIYTDPRDSGFGVGLPYPEGGYANAEYIQRGSIKTLAYDGDPLTPFVAASKDAKRLNPDEVDLPKIPVQPMGWGAAQKIMRLMKGRQVPSRWQGGLPFRYRLTGGPELRVRLAVQQDYRLTKTHNVIATLRGTDYPDEMVILGSHHDSWNHGAGDPTAGLITVLEAARAFGLAAARGFKPKRSIVFAAWGAEEPGIIGSVEWIEANLERLKKYAVAYINLDMAAMGPRFGSSSSPSLKRIIARAAANVPQARAPDKTVLGDWLTRGVNPNDPTLPRFGDMGGGSDHVGFIALGGIPCASLGGGGSPGVAYHSNYDNLDWYRKIVGEDYEPALMVARMAALTALYLAATHSVPLDPERIGVETRRHLAAITARGRETGLFKEDRRDITWELAKIEAAALQLERRASELSIDRRLNQAAPKNAAGINELLFAMERAWLWDAGIPGRPWFRNLYAATDESSGYAPWMLPALRYAVEHRDKEALASAEKQYLTVFQRLEELMTKLDGVLGDRNPGTGSNLRVTD